jgi:hypothetical protein
MKPPSRPSPTGEGGKQNKPFPLGGNKKGGKKAQKNENSVVLIII